MLPLDLLLKSDSGAYYRIIGLWRLDVMDRIWWETWKLVKLILTCPWNRSQCTPRYRTCRKTYFRSEFLNLFSFTYPLASHHCCTYPNSFIHSFLHRTDEKLRNKFDNWKFGNICFNYYVPIPTINIKKIHVYKVFNLILTWSLTFIILLK